MGKQLGQEVLHLLLPVGGWTGAVSGVGGIGLFKPRTDFAAPLFLWREHLLDGYVLNRYVLNQCGLLEYRWIRGRSICRRLARISY
jgi:hypothetical protein